MQQTLGKYLQQISKRLKHFKCRIVHHMFDMCSAVIGNYCGIFNLENILSLINNFADYSIHDNL